MEQRWEVATQVKALTTETFVPPAWNFMVEGENWLLQVVHHPPTTINTSTSNRKQQQTVTGTGEMAQLAKCLLGKSEDVTSDI